MEEFSNFVLIITTIRMATPLMLVSLGGVFSESYSIRATYQNSRREPKVAETVGINAWGIRYFAVITSGIFAGLAGAYLSLGQMNMLQEGMSSGRGFLALEAVIMGRWTLHGAVLASLFFRLFKALQLQLEMMPNVPIPYELLQSMPYIASLIVLATAFGKSRSPVVNGVPYLKRS